MATIDSPARRNFLGSVVKGAGATALAGAGLSTASLQAAPADSARLRGDAFDLDTPYERRGSNCSRWDSPVRRYGDKFRYGMGIASMDFQAPPCIAEALAERCGHESWGYLSSTAGLKEGIIAWNGERHGVDLSPAQIEISAGVYPGIIAALRTFVPAGTKVLMLSPIYSGFYYHCDHTRVDAVDSPLVFRGGRYEIDWQDLESKMTPDVNAMIVCNPQNPTGNVWTEEELLRIGRLCLDKQIVVLADEIHSDIVRPGHRYVPFASLPDQAVVNNSVSFNAISKTFNLAGMKNAYFYSPNPVLLNRVRQNHRADLNTLGVVANEAAYKQGGTWFDQVLPYLDANHAFTENYLREQLPMVGYTPAEGTFLAWLDFSAVLEAINAKEMAAMHGLESPEHYFQDWLVEHSGVLLNPGSNYGSGGAGYMRMNIASARVVVKEALDAMAGALRQV